jgi:hypothetical protein
MRPLYESSKDLSNELRVAKILKDCWEADFVKLTMAYHVDWAVVRGPEIVAFAEFKRRHNPKDQYPSFMISLNKWMNGKKMGKEVGVPFLIIVEWDDGLYYTNSEVVKPKYGLGGRWDRKDSQDQEPCAFIETKAFYKVRKNARES